MASLRSSKNGLSLIEAVIGVAIIGFVLFGVIAVSQRSVRVVATKSDRLVATLLAEESLEVTRLVRDSGWANLGALARGEPYYPVFSATTSAWSLESADPGPVFGTFTRTATVEDVYRRASDDDIIDAVSPDPKVLDPETLKVTARVLWDDSGATTTVEFVAYLANIFEQ